MGAQGVTVNIPVTGVVPALFFELRDRDLVSGDFMYTDGKIVPVEAEFMTYVWEIEQNDEIVGFGKVATIWNAPNGTMFRIRDYSGRAIMMEGDMQVLVRKFTDSESGEPLPVEVVLVEDDIEGEGSVFGDSEYEPDPDDFHDDPDEDYDNAPTDEDIADEEAMVFG